MNILCAVAEFEHEIIRERVKAGSSWREVWPGLGLSTRTAIVWRGFALKDTVDAQ
jgi:hypothetical protein